MNKFSKIEKAISKGKTILGVGPMSKNCIDAVIEISNEKLIPILLICSRRQIETDSLGGGYVMSTEELSDYVRKNDKKKCVFLCRDHGGPLQGSNDELFKQESFITHDEAETSFRADIENDFDIIHIDPSKIPNIDIKEVIYEIEYYYNFCEECGNDNLIYEVGTEEHNGQITTLENFNYFVNSIKELEKVKFVVGNVGTLVKEMDNVGNFYYEEAKDLLNICNDNNLYLKCHNCDYLYETELTEINNIKTHSINVAPQFGVIETKTLLENILNENIRNEIIDIFYNSYKWLKWLSRERENKEYKAKICGHYNFNNQKFIDTMNKLSQEEREIIDYNCKQAVKNGILFYLKNLGW